MIWREALTEPQIIPIKGRSLKSKKPYAVPLVLHSPLRRVCSMSRKEAEKVQTPLFNVRKGVPKIYVNLSIDILWVPSLDKEILRFRGLSDEKKKQIQKLAIYADFGLQPIVRMSPIWTYKHLVQLTGLKELYLTMGSDNDIAREEITFVNPTKLPPFPIEFLRKEPEIDQQGCMLPVIKDALNEVHHRK